jgi:hypothetical protein
MTVAATTNRKTYTGDNVTTSFATSPVIFYLSSNLQVRITVIATGVSTLLTENTHYTVSGGSAAGATGTVNLAGGSAPRGALLSTETLVILRVLPLTQAVDLVNNNASDAEVIETALDKLTDVDQQLSERQDRALTFPEGDVSGSTTTLQTASVRAGRLLGFDALGVLTTLVVTVGTSLVDLATSAGSTLIGFIQAGTGAVLRTLQARLRDTVCVFDYMTAAQIADVQAGTLLIDVTTAVQNAIAFGYRVYFPAGSYKLTSGLSMTLNATWYGDGPRKTIFSQATNFNVITINNIQGWRLQGFQIQNTQTSASVTSGDAIKLSGSAQYGVLDQIYINNCYNGVHVQNAPILRAYSVDIQYFKNAGWLFDGGTNFDAYIYGGVVDGALSSAAPTTQNGTYSIRLVDMCEEIVFHSGVFNGCVNNLSTTATVYGLTVRPAYCCFENCSFDNSTGGLLVDQCVDMTFVGCWISNRGIGATVGTTNSDGVTFDACSFGNNDSHGLQIQAAAKRTTLLGCKVVGNNKGVVGAHGIIVADTCNDFSIVDCICANGWGFSGLQGYGIVINGTSHTRYALIGNNVTGNATGGILDGTTGSPERYVHDNIGYRTENAGVTGAIATGATVTHGLALTPTAVILTAQDGTPTAVFPSAIGATTFVINYTGGGTHAFSWSAQTSL